MLDSLVPIPAQEVLSVSLEHAQCVSGSSGFRQKLSLGKQIHLITGSREKVKVLNQSDHQDKLKHRNFHEPNLRQLI